MFRIEGKMNENDIETQLVKTINTLSKLSVFVTKYDGNEKGEADYFNSLNQMLSQLKNLQRIPREEYDMEISQEILKCLDLGFSPDVFLTQMKDSVVQRLNETKGKINAFKTFKETLEKKMEQSNNENTKAKE